MVRTLLCAVIRAMASTFLAVAEHFASHHRHNTRFMSFTCIVHTYVTLNALRWCEANTQNGEKWRVFAPQAVLLSHAVYLIIICNRFTATLRSFFSVLLHVMCIRLHLNLIYQFGVKRISCSVSPDWNAKRTSLFCAKHRAPTLRTLFSNSFLWC